MITIHLFVPFMDAKEIVDRISSDFRITSQWPRNRFNQSLFIIETTEEELVFLKLKYGNKNAWKR